MIKNKIYRSLIFLCVVLIVVITTMIYSKKADPDDNYMVFGNKIDNNNHEKLLMDLDNNNYFNSSNSTFTSNNINTSTLLRLIENNSKKSIDGKLVKISEVIKSSKCMSLVIGNGDLTDKIDYNRENKELNYDFDLLYRQIEISSANIHSIIDEIHSINNNIDVFVIGAYNPFYDYFGINKDALHTIFNAYNNYIKDICIQTNSNFIDVSLLSSVDYFVNDGYTINGDGSEYLANKIYYSIQNHYEN